MYYYFAINEKPQKQEVKEAIKKMDEISTQWEDEDTPFGKLFLGVFDWDYTNGKYGVELKIPNLRNGGSIPKNETASAFFGFDIFGECFLKPKADKIVEIETKINN